VPSGAADSDKKAEAFWGLGFSAMSKIRREILQPTETRNVGFRMTMLIASSIAEDFCVGAGGYDADQALIVEIEVDFEVFRFNG